MTGRYKGWKEIIPFVFLSGGLVAAIFLVLQRQFFSKKAAVLPETVYFVHSDHLGSTSVITDSAGNAMSYRAYYAYGNTRSTSGSELTDRQYTGQISDMDETGLYYYNARYYSPTLAKFTQADTINDQLNRYAYVGNNPIKFLDPSGHKNCEEDGYCPKIEKSAWDETLDSYNTYVDIITTDPLYTSTVLTMSAVTAGGVALTACIANPLSCSAAATLITADTTSMDTQLDINQCASGDWFSCGSIALPAVTGAAIKNLAAKGLAFIAKTADILVPPSVLNLFTHADDDLINIAKMNTVCPEAAEWDLLVDYIPSKGYSINNKPRSAMGEAGGFANVGLNSMDVVQLEDIVNKRNKSLLDGIYIRNNTILHEAQHLNTGLPAGFRTEIIAYTVSAYGGRSKPFTNALWSATYRRARKDSSSFAAAIFNIVQK